MGRARRGFFAGEEHRLAFIKGACIRCADLTGNVIRRYRRHAHRSAEGGELKSASAQHRFAHLLDGPEGIDEFRKTVLRSDASVRLRSGDFNGDGVS